MHVCSTLWTGALADDLEMSGEERAEHNARRPAHYRRIVENGAIYSQPFSEGGAAAAGAARSETEASRSTAASWSAARKSSPRFPARPIITASSAPSAAKARLQAAATRFISRCGQCARRQCRRRLGPARHARHGLAHAADERRVRPESELLMPHGVYFRAATSWPHMFLTLSPTYMGLAQAAYDFTVAYLRGEVPGTPPVKRRMFPTKQIAVAEMRVMLEQTKALWFQAVSEARANPTKEQVLRAYAAQHTVMENANALAAKAIRTCGGQSMLKKPAAGAHLSRQPLRLADAAVDGGDLHRPAGQGDVVRSW